METHVSAERVPSHAAHLAAVLDERRFGKDENAWTAEVVGIHADEREVWVQVTRAGQPGTSLVLRLSTRATAAHALAALSRCGPPPDLGLRILDVMRRV